MNPNSIVIGYHGCTCLTAEKIFRGKVQHLKKSEHDYDWLGDGIYFWENDYERALNWAKAHIKRKKLNHVSPAVVGCVIVPTHCLDLTTSVDIQLLKSHYQLYEKILITAGVEKDQFPQNKKASSSDTDCLLRKLDCSVIKFLHKTRELADERCFDSVRGAFYEGAPAFEGSKIMEKTHIQWAIRNPEKCILGYFRPTKTGS